MKLKVITTLSKQCKEGRTSTWKFGQLPNGWFAAKCLETGVKKFWRTLPAMDKCIDTYMQRYGYTKPSACLVRQLSLAV